VTKDKEKELTKNYSKYQEISDEISRLWFQEFLTGEPYIIPKHPGGNPYPSGSNQFGTGR